MNVYQNIKTSVLVDIGDLFGRPGFSRIAPLPWCWSFMQTLGVSHPRYDAYRKQFAGAFSALVCIGFAIVPIAVIAGWVK